MKRGNEKSLGLSTREQSQFIVEAPKLPASKVTR